MMRCDRAQIDSYLCLHSGISPRDMAHDWLVMFERIHQLETQIEHLQRAAEATNAKS